MNSKFFGKNRIPMQILVQIILCLGLVIAAYAIVLANPIRGGADSQRSASSTKTALAMTAGALLGPFPTATVPTVTASDLPTITSTLPSATPTVTRTLTPTRTPVVTLIPRTREADPDVPNSGASTPIPPTSAPATSIPPTSVPPTNPPPPTDPPTEPPPTNPPVDPPPTLPPIELPPLIQRLLP